MPATRTTTLVVDVHPSAVGVLIAALSVASVVVSVLLTVIAAGTLWWMMHAWRRPEVYEAMRGSTDGSAELSFSLIVPCRDETELVVGETVRRLLAQDHPDFEIIISVGHDDLSTIEAASAIAGRDPRVRVAVNHDETKNKPRQLNTTLAVCRKQVVGIFDAESLTAPGLLRRVDATFRHEGADVVQGAVHLVNLRSRWFSLRNCLEYRIWFRSRLHGHADNGFVPLGGNTVFIRRDLLDEVGGWDGDCLAEDCEIGVRLSVRGHKTVCLYESDLVTQEETPDTVRAFVKQRTRWALGFMQVMAKGEWRKLPTRSERVRALWLLSQQYAAAFSGIVIPLAVVAAVVGGLPVLVVLITFLPLATAVMTLAFEAVILQEFGAHLGIRVRVRDYVWLVVSTPFYQLMLAVASLRAVVKYVSGNFAWEKTAHVGAHLGVAAEPERQAA